MNGCTCGCGGGRGNGPRFAQMTTREERIERLEAFQRDLEQRVADVAGEIGRLKDTPEPGATT